MKCPDDIEIVINFVPCKHGKDRTEPGWSPPISPATGFRIMAFIFLVALAFYISGLIADM